MEKSGIVYGQIQVFSGEEVKKLTDSLMNGTAAGRTGIMAE